jgi:hypothetical protein
MTRLEVKITSRMTMSTKRSCTTETNLTLQVITVFSNVAEEEIAKQFPTERREMIFCAIPMTEKWPFWHYLVTGDNNFFSAGNQIFFTTFQYSCLWRCLKIKFSIFFDRMPQLWVQKAPFGAYLKFLVLQFR